MEQTGEKHCTERPDGVTAGQRGSSSSECNTTKHTAALKARRGHAELQGSFPDWTQNTNDAGSQMTTEDLEEV